MHRGLGFTLLELLAAVLIVGILAAVAIPQYRKAVTKAKNREAAAALRSIGQAIEMYDLANGPLPEERSNDFSILGIKPPASGKWKYYFFCYDEFKSCVVTAQGFETLDVGDSGYWLSQWVDKGRVTPGVTVSKSTRLPDEGEDVSVTWTSSVDKAFCLQSGGHMEDGTCLIN